MARNNRGQPQFWNVLSNAAKYTPRDGSIHLRIAPTHWLSTSTAGRSRIIDAPWLIAS